MSRKICISVGHGCNSKGVYDPGAVSKDKKYHEHKIARQIAFYAAEYLGCDLINYDGRLCLTNRIKAVNAGNYDFAADIHLNAGGGNGTETYYYHGSPTGKKSAEAICREISGSLNIKNRGAKIKLNALGSDYFGFIRQTKPCAILIETAFIDSDGDLEKLKTEEGRKKCGIAIGKALESALAEYAGYTVLKDCFVRQEPLKNGKQVKKLAAGKSVIISITSSDEKWGKLRDGSGWIYLSKNFVKKVTE